MAAVDTCGKIASKESKTAISNADYNEDLKIDVPKDPSYPKAEKVRIVTEEIVATGKGQFDKYMRAGNNQLQTQYDAGRIKGADYATAYVQMMATMMDEANKFVISEYQARILAEKTAVEIGEMKAEGKLKRELLAVQVEKEKMAIRHLKLQMDKTIAETQLLTTQEEEMRKTGAVERSAKAAQERLTCTQAEELVLNGTSKRSLEASDTALKGTQKSELVANGASKRALEGAQAEASRQQVTLYKAQATSFANKDMNDTLKTIMNGYAVVVSENSVTTAGNLNAGPVGSTIGSAKAKVGLA